MGAKELDVVENRTAFAVFSNVSFNLRQELYQLQAEKEKERAYLVEDLP